MSDYIVSGVLQAIPLLPVGRLRQDLYLAVLAGQLVLVGRTHDMLPGYHERFRDNEAGSAQEECCDGFL
jgi:hypothetical protein